MLRTLDVQEHLDVELRMLVHPLGEGLEDQMPVSLIMQRRQGPLPPVVVRTPR